MAEQPVLTLASASPRRTALLGQLGIVHHCDPADIDESQLPGEAPEAYVERLANAKAACVAGRNDLSLRPVLAADTTVAIDGDVLGKPADRLDALAMLARLSGRSHTVLTAVCLHSADGVYSELVSTQVNFLTLSREICEAYLDTDEPWDKAGGYAIQGLGGALVSRIEGSYSNVVGLPLAETWQLLARGGIITALDTYRE